MPEFPWNQHEPKQFKQPLSPWVKYVALAVAAFLVGAILL